eukprot:CFRG1244T1
MGVFLLQVRLLIWKNALLKFRRPIALAVELLTPAFLVAIAALIRLALPTEDVGETMKKAWALPPYHNASVDFAENFELTAAQYFSRKIAYSPTGGEVDAIMAQLQLEISDLVDGVDFNSTIVGFSNSEDMLQFAVQANGELDLLAALDFTNVANPNTLQATVPLNVEYIVRQDEDATYDTGYQFPEIIPLGPRTGTRYQRFGFTMIQNMLDQSIMAVKANLTAIPIQVVQQPGPFPAYTDDEFARGLGFFLPLFTVFSFIYPCAMIVKSLVMEKELRLREAQRLMGCKNLGFWTSWWVVSFINLAVSTLAVGLILILADVVVDTSPGVIYLFLYLNVLATISFAFMVSTFFSRAKVAAAMGACLYFIFYIPYFFVAPSERYDSLSNEAKLLVSLLSPTAFGLGTKVISRYEEQGKELDFSSIRTPATFNDDFTLGLACAMLLLDSVLYLLIALYVDNVFPGTYGIPQKWYYFVTSTYWRGNHDGQHVDDTDTTECPNNVQFEAGEVNDGMNGKGGSSCTTDRLGGVLEEQLDASEMNMFAGIDLRNLTKVYSSGKKVAVDNLSFKAYEGQITSFLGHNGAGKTSTMSMLSGLFPPTSGDAYVNGYSIRRQMPKVRKSLGLCPQFDILYDNLTVEEHLKFYCKLKQVDDHLISASIDEVLKELNIYKKKNARAKTLSGGMKRKLSVAIALVGGSKVVVLDEPTAGMDPYSRRSTWEFLLRQRKGRTILLSTHFMDEADLLGDRIAIISNGALKCIGSSLFLKKAYGAGYHLVCTARRSTGANSNALIHTASSRVSGMKPPIDVDILTNLIKSHVPTAKLESSVGVEIAYTMPADQVKAFANLLLDLDACDDVEDYGLSMTTMEEVFLAANEFNNMSSEDRNDSDIPNASTEGFISVAQGSCTVTEVEGSTKNVLAEEKNSVLHRTRSSTMGINKAADSLTTYDGKSVVDSKAMEMYGIDKDEAPIRSKLFQPSPLKTGIALKRQQYFAMVRKRYIHTKRDKTAVICQWLFPILFMILAMVLARTIDQSLDQPALVFSPHDLDNAFVPIQNVNTDDITSESIVQQITQLFSPTSITDVPPTTNYTSMWINDTYVDLEPISYAGYIFQSTNPGGGATGSQEVFATEYYQNIAWHASAIYLNTLNNAVGKVFVSPDFSISTTNYPLPLSAAAQSNRINEGGQELAVAIFTIFAMSFLAASFVTFVVDERETKAKHIQLVSGVDTISFWLATYTWDLINYLVPVILILIIILASQVEFYTGYNYPAVILLFLCFGWAVIPLMYIFSFMFKVPSTALAVMILANMLLGLATSLAAFVLDQYEDLVDISNILQWVFLIFPQYCLGRGLMDVSYNYVFGEISDVLATNDLYSGGFSYEKQNPLVWSVVGRNIVFLIFEGLIFFGIVLLIEYKFFLPTKQKNANSNLTLEEEDADVKAERERVEAMRTDNGNGCDEDVVVMDNLCKVFDTKKGPFVAVKGVSVGVSKAECFGLLGVNGAGKTTTFKMLTGDLKATSGNAYLENHSVVSQLRDARKSIGYCPQFDALIGLMTGRETLEMYARLRGIQEHEIDEAVTAIIRMLHLENWADRMSRTYSGGNKRKLSTGIALVGSPPIIFLDEPTTGMDPAAKRFLWNTLNDVRSQGRALVLTSHSMEEVSAICTRLVIMVNGSFKCLGNQQYLKNKYGDGYALIVKVKKDVDTSGISDFVTESFPNSVLKEKYSRMLTWQLDVKELRLADVFSKMEDVRERFGIDDFTVSQTSLEQVFIRFAKAQGVVDGEEDELQRTSEEDVLNSQNPSCLGEANAPTIEKGSKDDFGDAQNGSSGEARGRNGSVPFSHDVLV